MSQKDLQSYLQKWLKEEMLKNGIVEYQINVTTSGGKGDGFTGSVIFFESLAKDSRGNSKKFNYVLKKGVENDELRKKAPITKMYEIEMDFYRKIFPTFENFQNDHKVKNPFRNVPQFVTSTVDGGTEYIILRNLNDSGFELHDKEICMNMEHMKLVFTTYAKFHALSFAVRHKNPKLFRELTANLEDIKKGFVVMGGLMPAITDVLNDAKRLLKDEDFVLQKYQQVIDQTPFVLLDMIDPKDPYNVITHGDCWNNNQMFKYGEEGKKKPIDISLLDWQVCVLAPVTYDLSYLLFASGSQECLNSSEELLEIYYESLSEHLRQLKCDPNKLFPKEQFKLTWKKYAIYGLIFTIYVLKLVLMKEEDISDLGDSSQSDAFKDMIASKGSPIYEERIRKMIRYYTQHIAP